MQRQIDELNRRVSAIEKTLSELHGSGNVAMMIRDREYERVLKRMDIIANTYGDHQTWRRADKDEYVILRKRRDELRKVLGIKC